MNKKKIATFGGRSKAVKVTNFPLQRNEIHKLFSPSNKMRRFEQKKKGTFQVDAFIMIIKCFPNSL